MRCTNIVDFEEVLKERDEAHQGPTPSSSVIDEVISEKVTYKYRKPFYINYKCAKKGFDSTFLITNAYTSEKICTISVFQYNASTNGNCRQAKYEVKSHIKNVYTFDELLNYLYNEVAKHEQHVDDQIHKFTDNLYSKGITLEDFLDLAGDYMSLDYTSKRVLDQSRK